MRNEEAGFVGLRSVCRCGGAARGAGVYLLAETGGRPVVWGWPPMPEDGRPEKKTLKHLGDITKINGAEVEPVWCITGGSPCQDLSIARKRAGLAGARSGLYMEQIRIVKEMREHDRSIGRTGELVRPRYMVWENVPGAFSSNFKDGFGDFGAVLEEAVRIAEPGFSLPRLPDKQKWTKAGGMLGDGWSVAWRTHDAQYWGVPQRRRRISMVVDFNGHTAGDILFERFGGAERSGGHEAVPDPGRESQPEVQPDAESVRRDSPEGGTAREETAGGAENCSAYAVRIRGDCDGGDKDCLTPWDCQSKRVFSTEAKSPCLQGGVGGGVNNPTIFCLQGNGIDCVCAVDCRNFGEGGEINGTLQAKSNGGISYNLQNTVRTGMVVRRLTPLECTRLQGYPDGWVGIGDWTDEKGRVHKEADAPKYKALGNSIALPFWRWMFGRMAAFLPEGATLGSLFDGIGGFPLCWESIHGAGTARWASEIEEFPIAVTKQHFEESNNK